MWFNEKKYESYRSLVVAQADKARLNGDLYEKYKASNDFIGMTSYTCKPSLLIHEAFWESDLNYQVTSQTYEPVPWLR